MISIRLNMLKSIFVQLFNPIFFLHCLIIIYMDTNPPVHLSTIHNTNNTVIYLTGFGKFGTHDINPTQQLVRSITPQECKKYGIQQTQVLDVSCKAVDQWISKVKPQADKLSESKPVWFVHLGVGNNTVYHMEQLAYNNKDFGRPDNEGYYCQNQPICEVLKLQHSLRCKTDLSVICKDLKPCHKMLVSQDPGRYLCNYIYFKSLNELSANNPRINSIFIHFPTSQFTSLQQNREFLLNVFSWLHKFTVCDDKGCKLKQ